MIPVIKAESFCFQLFDAVGHGSHVVRGPTIGARRFQQEPATGLHFVDGAKTSVLC